ncbi:bifunctional 4-hydroxy-3-methylbut-2-enyl diphosphate reductase/30S ribosomal protein S1 [Clostridium sp. DL1XJH146]
MKNITISKNSGFCFGVQRAVNIALDTAEANNNKIYTLGPLIHNSDVVNYLKEKQIEAIDFVNIDKLIEDDLIIIRSHGISPLVKKNLEERNLKIVDATCPYVSKIHDKVKKYYELGYNIIIIGDKNHPEVKGINGCSNNTAYVVKNIVDIPLNLDHFCVVAQTTEKTHTYDTIIKELEKNNKDFIDFKTICNATKVRQGAAEQISKSADLMLVLGGYNSSNTRKLYEICKNNCNNTIHIENAGEIPDEIKKSKNISNIGITAGASTPDWIIREAVQLMSENDTMENDLMNQYLNKTEKNISVGDKIKGEVVHVNKDEAYLNVGNKNDAKLPKTELTKEDNKDMTSLVNIGDIIEVKIIKLGSLENEMIVSVLEIEREKAVEELKEAFDNNQEIQIKLKEAVKGGMIASYKGVRVFIPASHIELFHIENLNDYVGKITNANIIEFKNESRGTKVVASRRKILSEEKKKNELTAWDSFEPGQIVEGTVKRLADFGAFIEVNGVDGLLHVSQLSWGRVNKPSDILTVNQKITVCILEANKDDKRLSLSIKKMSEDPWETVEEKYPIGSIVLGKLVRFADFGVFVELEPGIDGLVHISQISHKRINKPSDVLEKGATIKAKILNVNSENKKIGLSIKEAEEI